ncbi:MAG: hypothetical protein NTW99_03195 [Chloroflexi bacterium]|nr:hypothetical protein [Chloroflexota bacterium]
MESARVTNTLPGAAVPGEASWVGRFLSRVAPLTWETVLLFSLAAAGLFSRLWALGAVSSSPISMLVLNPSG